MEPDGQTQESQAAMGFAKGGDYRDLSCAVRPRKRSRESHRGHTWRQGKPPDWMVSILMLLPPRLQNRGPDTWVSGTKVTAELVKNQKEWKSPFFFARLSYFCAVRKKTDTRRKSSPGMRKVSRDKNSNPPPAENTVGLDARRKTLL